MSDGKTTGTQPPPQAPALPPLVGFRLILTVMLTALANLFATLDLTIANVSIPTISSGLGVSPHEGTWVITSYAVAEAITVSLTGWLAARFGPGRSFVFALTAFALTSGLCAFSVSFPMLVTFRVLQGLAGGPMIPLSQTILLSTLPKEKSSTAVGIWSMTSVLGPVLGPILGGQIVDHFSWPWIFLINVPVVLITAYFCSRLLLPRDAPPQHRPVDLVGFGLMIVWISALQISLDRGQELDWFGSPLIVALCVVGTIGFVAFLIWELTEPNPIVNLRIFRYRSFLVATTVMMIGFGSYFGSVVLTPLWMQTNMGYTPTWAGYANAPPGAMVFCFSPLVAWVSSRVDTRILISIALIIFSGVFFWRSHFASNITFGVIIASQAMVGVCIAFFFAPVMTLAMGSVKPQEVASAAGLMSFCRTASLSFGTSISTTVWQNATARDRVTIIDQFRGNAALDKFNGISSMPGQALNFLDNMVQDQAVMLATNDTYFLFACAMLIGSIYIWASPPKSGNLRGGH